MSPHGPDVARPYFEEPLEGELVAHEVNQLRELLQTAELRYLCCDETEPMVPNQELLTFARVQEIPNLFDGRIATVLLTSRP